MSLANQFLNSMFGGITSPLDIPGILLWLEPDDQTTVWTQVAAEFVAASNAELSIASNSSLQGGGTDLAIGGWFKLDSKPGAMGLMGKWEANTSNAEYLLFYLDTIDAFRFQLSTSGTGAGTIAVESSITPLSTGVWYFVVGWLDQGNSINIQVNNGAVDTTLTAGDIYTGTANYRHGNYKTGVGADRFLDGAMDSAFLYKTLLSASDRTGLYNGGTLLSYVDLTPAQKTGLISWWDHNELTASESRVDEHVTNDLSSSNVTSTGGKDPSAAVDGDPIHLWQDKSGNLRNATQSVTTGRGILRTGIINGRDVIRLDGVDDLYSLASAMNLIPGTLFVVAVHSNTSLGQQLSHSSLNNQVRYEANQTQFGAREGTADLQVTSSVIDTSVAVVMTYVFTASGITIYANGVQVGTDAHSVAAFALDQVGMRAVASEPLAGDIAEIIAYDSALGVDLRGQMETLLKVKYGI